MLVWNTATKLSFAGCREAVIEEAPTWDNVKITDLPDTNATPNSYHYLELYQDCM